MFLRQVYEKEDECASAPTSIAWPLSQLLCHSRGDPHACLVLTRTRRHCWAGLFWFARSFGRHPRTGRAYRQGGGDASLKEQLAQGLTPYQLSLLEKVRRANTDPIVKYPRKSERPEADQLASVEIHKRVNPGYVEMPYESSNSRDYKYMAAPDFTREYLKSDSDLHFAKFAAAALTHSVPLNKTSH